MIDVDLMLEEAEKQKAMHFVMAAGFTNSEIIFMLTRLREAEKDAARYKYLKSDHKTKNLYSYQQDMKDRYWDEDIDSEIDQAMKENKDGLL